MRGQTSLSVGVVTLVVTRKFLVHYPGVAGSTDFMSE